MTLEDTARYAGLVLSPSFYAVLAHFWQFLVSSSNKCKNNQKNQEKKSLKKSKKSIKKPQKSKNCQNWSKNPKIPNNLEKSQKLTFIFFCSCKKKKKAILSVFQY